MSELDRQIQATLKGRGYFLGNTGPNKDGIDGVLGDVSKRAILAEFAKTAQPGSAPEDRAHGLTNPDAFYAELRGSGLFPKGFTVPQVQGINFKLAAMASAAYPVSHAAYGMGTGYHETGARMVPVREGFADSDAEARRIVARRDYGKPGRNRGQVAYGRGDVQLTWDDNYERADRELGLNGALIANYDKALDPEISAHIMVRGMTAGWFSKDKIGPRSLPRYLPNPVATREQFVSARPIINLTDKADQIAGYAVVFQRALLAGGWH